VKSSAGNIFDLNRFNVGYSYFTWFDDCSEVDQWFDIADRVLEKLIFKILSRLS